MKYVWRLEYDARWAQPSIWQVLEQACTDSLSSSIPPMLILLVFMPACRTRAALGKAQSQAAQLETAMRHMQREVADAKEAGNARVSELEDEVRIDTLLTRIC